MAKDLTCRATATVTVERSVSIYNPEFAAEEFRRWLADEFGNQALISRLQVVDPHDGTVYLDDDGFHRERCWWLSDVAKSIDPSEDDR